MKYLFLFYLFYRHLVSFSSMKLMLLDQQENNGRATQRRRYINYLLKWMGLSRMRYLWTVWSAKCSSGFRNWFCQNCV